MRRVRRARGPDVERDHRAAADQRREMRRLAAGRGARVEHARPRRRRDERRDELRGLALECEASRAPCGRGAQPRGAAPDDERVRRPLAVDGLRAGGGELRAERVPRRTQAVGAYGDGPAHVVALEEADEIVRLEVARPALHQPAGMRPLDRHAPERVGRRVGQRQAVAARGRRASQHRVHQPDGRAPRAPDEADARVDRRICGDTLEEEELVEAEPERRVHRRLEARERRADEAGEVMVEPALPRERAVDEARGERRIGGAQARGPQALRKEDVGERVGGRDAHEHLVRQAARVRSAGG